MIARQPLLGDTIQFLSDTEEWVTTGTVTSTKGNVVFMDNLDRRCFIWRFVESTGNTCYNNRHRIKE